MRSTNMAIEKLIESAEHCDLGACADCPSRGRIGCKERVMGELAREVKRIQTENAKLRAESNEPLTQADVDEMHFDRVWIDYGLDDEGEQCGEEGVVLYGKLYSIDTLEGAGFEDMLLDICDGETLDRPSGNYTVYRRPQEGEDKL